MRKNVISLVLLLLCFMPAVAQKYKINSVRGERILIDGRYAADKDAEAFLSPYKHVVDSVMSPVVGTTARYLKSYAPESELSNLLADIMVWCGTRYGEKADIGIYNLGGIRAALPAGDITFGDVVDVAPFENKICFLSLTGEQLVTLFRQMMKANGGGLSKGVRAVVNGRELVSLTLNGEDIDPQRVYRIATLDYIAQGNDGFRELQNAFDVNSPKDEYSNTRYLITEYFREKKKAGEIIDSKIEGRVIVQ